MKVYLIRHGATPGNLEKRYVGTTDEPLTKDAVTALKKLRVRYPIPVQVVTSPLKRCMQTASLLFPGIPSECCDGLKECDLAGSSTTTIWSLAGMQSTSAGSTATVPAVSGR